MLDIDDIRGEVERLRIQVGRHRKGMLGKIEALCAERDRLKAELPKPRKVLGGRKW